MGTQMTAYKQHKALLAQMALELSNLARIIDTNTDLPTETTEAAWALVDETKSTLERKKGSGRKPKSGVTLAEFNKAVHGDGRGGFPLVITIGIVAEVYSPAKRWGPAHIGGEHVEWTCPNCGHKNDHFWTGRGYYVCLGCDQGTDLKGPTA